MLKFLIVLVISFSTYVSAKETKFEKRLQKDIKKLSRISGFVDDDLNLYSEDEITDRKKMAINRMAEEEDVKRLNKEA